MTSQDQHDSRISLTAMQDNLSRIGYDIEPAQPGDPPHSSVVARRDLGDRVVLVAIDASGRFRIDISRMVDEWSQAATVAGIPVHAVETVRSSLNLTGQISSQVEANSLVAALSNLDLSLHRSRDASESLNQDAKPQQ
jgi:hypothetical protein